MGIQVNWVRTYIFRLFRAGTGNDREKYPVSNHLLIIPIIISPKHFNTCHINLSILLCISHCFSSRLVNRTFHRDTVLATHVSTNHGSNLDPSHFCRPNGRHQRFGFYFEHIRWRFYLYFDSIHLDRSYNAQLHSHLHTECPSPAYSGSRSN